MLFGNLFVFYYSPLNDICSITAQIGIFLSVRSKKVSNCLFSNLMVISQPLSKLQNRGTFAN